MREREEDGMDHLLFSTQQRKNSKYCSPPLSAEVNACKVLVYSPTQHGMALRGGMYKLRHGMARLAGCANELLLAYINQRRGCKFLSLGHKEGSMYLYCIGSSVWLVHKS